MPVSRTIGGAGRSRRIVSTTLHPLIEGMTTSTMTRSHRPSAKRAKPLAPSDSVWTLYPNEARRCPKTSRTLGSSSIRSIRGRATLDTEAPVPRLTANHIPCQSQRWTIDSRPLGDSLRGGGAAFGRI